MTLLQSSSESLLERESCCPLPLAGVALPAGIGFTMSLFISGLAFKNPVFMDQAKYGILVASVFAGIVGTVVLRRIGGSFNKIILH